MKAAKKQSIVVKVVLGILAVLAVLGALTAAAIYKWYTAPETQEKLGAAKDLVRMNIEAARAPGAEELRKLGCQQAAIFDKEQAARYLESIGKVMAAPGTEKVRIPLVFCGVQPSSKLTCETVAITYGASVPGAGAEVLVMIQTQSIPQELICSGVYDREGTLVRKIEPGEM